MKCYCPYIFGIKFVSQNKSNHCFLYLFRANKFISSQKHFSERVGEVKKTISVLHPHYLANSLNQVFIALHGLENS